MGNGREKRGVREELERLSDPRVDAAKIASNSNNGDMDEATKTPKCSPAFLFPLRQFVLGSLRLD